MSVDWVGKTRLTTSGTPLIHYRPIHRVFKLIRSVHYQLCVYQMAINNT